MKKFSIIFLAAALMLSFMGCDKITDPLKPVNITNSGKTVLIKDFTGARCVNCPAAAEAAHELQHRLGEDYVIIMGVHAGSMAQPAGQFPNFLTNEGTEWYNDHDSNPLFAVDHVALTEGNTLYAEQIDTPVADALTEPKTFEVSIANEYDEANRQLSVASEVKALEEVEGDFYVTVCLVEDSIVGWQIEPSGVNREYVFRNVFRGTLNGTDGESVGDGTFNANDDVLLNHRMTLDTTFNADQCYILTYIYEKTDGKIMQTAVKKIK